MVETVGRTESCGRKRRVSTGEGGRRRKQDERGVVTLIPIPCERKRRSQLTVRKQSKREATHETEDYPDVHEHHQAVRAPDEVEDARHALPPRATVLPHLPAGDTDEGLNTVAKAGRRTGRDGDDVAVVYGRSRSQLAEGEERTEEDEHIVSSMMKVMASRTTIT